MVASVAIITIVVTAIGMMVGFVELASALKRIALVIGSLVLLLILPPIIMGMWRALSSWQQLGLSALLGLTVMFMARRGSSNANVHRARR
jgi:hypothetical protein